VSPTHENNIVPCAWLHESMPKIVRMHTLPGVASSHRFRLGVGPARPSAAGVESHRPEVPQAGVSPAPDPIPGVASHLEASRAAGPGVASHFEAMWGVCSTVSHSDTGLLGLLHGCTKKSKEARNN
jgi:hypothetical protein